MKKPDDQQEGRTSIDLSPGAIEALIGRLREWSPGFTKWYAMNRAESAYFIDFSWESEGVRWLDDQKRRFPEFVEREGIHLVKQHNFTELERIAIAAADVLAAMPLRLDEPAQVGGAVFRPGVEWRLVVGAAQRHHRYRNGLPNNEFPDRFTLADIQRMDTLVPQDKRRFVAYPDYEAMVRERDEALTRIEALNAELALLRNEQDEEKPAETAPVSDKVVDHCWTMYQVGQISADHTAKEVFAGVLRSFGKWLIGTREQAARDEVRDAA
jgi:hypothetical protein